MSDPIFLSQRLQQVRAASDRFLAKAVVELYLSNSRALDREQSDINQFQAPFPGEMRPLSPGSFLDDQ